MGNIRHKWMVLMVVLVTTFATAQEGVRQYDGLREQANEWASSRLLASLLNTSAPEEELVEAQTAVSSTSCSAEERSDEPAPRLATQTSSHQIETKSDALQHQDEAIHIAINETPDPAVMEHVELSEAGGDLLDSINEVSLLTDKNHAEMLQTLGQPEGMEEPESAPEDQDADAVSSVHAKQEMRLINRVREDASPRLSETDLNAIRASAAFEAQVQTRAARRVAVKVLQERSGRPIRVELKLIKRGQQPGGAGAAPLRVANIAPRMDTAEMPNVLPAPPALQPLAPLSQNSACAGE